MITVTADQVLAMLDRHQTFINEENHFPHIKPFELDDCEAFLKGAPGVERKWTSKSSYSGKPITGTSEASHQIKQAISAIGAGLVDQKKADPETHMLYKAIWKLEIPGAKCNQCKRPVQSLLLFPVETCHRPRCQLIAMRESL
jgi:hypothetical protein